MIDSRSDLRNLETFYYIAKLGTFQAAAQKLCTTQPAISQRISLLEGALGQRLFSRSTRRVSLTSKGRELLVHAEDILQRYQTMNVAVGGNAQAMRGTVRLGVPETLAHTWMYRLVQRLDELYPELTVEIELGSGPNMATQLINQQLDLVFTMSSAEGSRVENLALCQYPTCWVVGPGIDVGASPISLQDLANWPMLTSNSGTIHYNLMHSLFKEAGVKLPRTYNIMSLNLMLDMVHRNAGFTLLAPASFSQRLARNELRLVDVEGITPPSLNYKALWRRGTDCYIPSMVAQIAQQVAQEE